MFLKAAVADVSHHYADAALFKREYIKYKNPITTILFIHLFIFFSPDLRVKGGGGIPVPVCKKAFLKQRKPRSTSHWKTANIPAGYRYLAIRLAGYLANIPYISYYYSTTVISILKR